MATDIAGLPVNKADLASATKLKELAEGDNHALFLGRVKGSQRLFSVVTIKKVAKATEARLLVDLRDPRKKIPRKRVYASEIHAMKRVSKEEVEAMSSEGGSSEGGGETE